MLDGLMKRVRVLIGEVMVMLLVLVVIVEVAMLEMEESVMVTGGRVQVVVV